MLLTSPQKYRVLTWPVAHQILMKWIFRWGRFYRSSQIEALQEKHQLTDLIYQSSKEAVADLENRYAIVGARERGQIVTFLILDAGEYTYGGQPDSLLLRNLPRPDEDFRNAGIR